MTRQEEEALERIILVVLGVGCLVLAVLSLALPLYAISTSTGAISELGAWGWQGGDMAQLALGTTTAQGTASPLAPLACLAAGADAVVVGAVFARRGKAPLLLGALALVHGVVAAGVSAALITDNFPVPFLAISRELSVGGAIAVTAGWTPLAWGHAIGTAIALGGAGALHVRGKEASILGEAPLDKHPPGGQLALDELEAELLARAKFG